MVLGVSHPLLLGPDLFSGESCLVLVGGSSQVSNSHLQTIKRAGISWAWDHYPPYKIWNDPPSISISPSVSCFQFPLVVKWHHSLALHWSCAWKRPQRRLPRIRHQGMWKVGHSKTSKKKKGHMTSKCIYIPPWNLAELLKLAIFEAGDIRYLLQDLDFLIHGFLVDGKLISTSAWIKDQRCKHFLHFLTPLQDLWENLPKNKKQQWNLSSFQSALWLLWPCLLPFFFRKLSQFHKLSKSVEVPLKIEENDKRLLQSGFLKSDSPKIIRKTPLPAKNTTSQTFTTPFFLNGTVKHTANYCTHQKPVLPQSFPAEAFRAVFPTEAKRRSTSTGLSSQLPKIN